MTGDGLTTASKKNHFSFSIFDLQFVIGRGLTERDFFNDK
jgi:hypothetical protein